MLYTKELNLDECRNFLRDSNFGRIACSNNNQPYIVPFNFAFDGDEYIYAFSTLGQKILWMRENPQVCVEVEDITSTDDWTILVIFGRYEELSNQSESKKEKNYAHELLSNHPKWWKPAYIAGAYRQEVVEKSVYFRIHIEKITGRRVFSGEVEKIALTGKKAKRANLSTRGLW